MKSVVIAVVLCLVFAFSSTVYSEVEYRNLDYEKNPDILNYFALTDTCSFILGGYL
jgi:hypothetical protein